MFSASCKNSHPKLFCEKVILSKFPRFAGKHMAWGLFGNAAGEDRSTTSRKKSCLACAFAGVLRNFSEQRFYRTPSVDIF